MKGSEFSICSFIVTCTAEVTHRLIRRTDLRQCDLCGTSPTSLNPSHRLAPDVICAAQVPHR